ncbi:hypothetical protein HS088_TW05G00247 [Tripterygium wilfordii]|uniref:Uncharacterized protein n=1 Tax=Tripterygium wilfordii TaxID=458696 RepID=A0A7J7DMT3_TRIWF|nr:hypothetical protein HS088_TW05G00247 [Tripterygium wilfordii]
MHLGIGGFGDERDCGSQLALGVLELGLLVADLLHLKHALHDKLVLALFVSVAFILALPWQIELGLSAFVEGDQQVGALVPVRERHPRLHHLRLRGYHLLR